MDGWNGSGRTCPECGSARWILVCGVDQPDGPAGLVERACRGCGARWPMPEGDQTEVADG